VNGKFETVLQSCKKNWDKYGGFAAEDAPLKFAANLLEQIRANPEIAVPTVLPISRGIYLEWRVGDSLLYFEADEEWILQYSKNTFGEETSVLQYPKNTFAEETMEDTCFEKAYKVVVKFNENAA